MHDGTLIRFYVNGVLDPYQPAANITFGGNTENLYLGVDLAGGDEYFAGQIKNAKVFNQALAWPELLQ